MFTEQHYKAIAKVIRTTNGGNLAVISRRQLIENFAEMFAKDNERFKRELFTDAAIGALPEFSEPVNRTQDMAIAHAEGWHDELPREGCPECKVQYRR